MWDIFVTALKVAFIVWAVGVAVRAGGDSLSKSPSFRRRMEKKYGGEE